MSFGTEVADAYIEVHADTERFRRELRGRLASEMRRFATRMGKTFQDNLDLEAQSNMAGFQRALAKVSRTGDWNVIRRQFSSLDDMLKATRKEIRKLADTPIRVRIGTDDDGKAIFEDRPFFSGNQMQGLLDNLARWERLIRSEEAFDAHTDNAEKAYQLHLRYLRDVEDAYDENARRDAEVFKDRVRRLNDITRMTLESDQSIQRSNQRINEAIRRQNLATQRARHRADMDAWDAQFKLETLRAKISVQQRKEEEKRYREHLEQMGRDYDRIFIGRLTGSRSEFLNVIGRTFRPIENKFARITNGLLGQFDDRLRGLIDGFLRLTNLPIENGTLFRGVKNFIPTLGSAVIGLGLVVYGAQMLASLISGLAGMVVGVLSTAASALSALVVALGPGMAAAAVAAGTLALGVSGMTDSMKRGLAPLQEWGNELKGIVARNLFGNIRTQVEQLLVPLREFASPMFASAAARLSEAMDKFLASINASDFRNTMATLRDTLPAIAGNLASALGSLATGLSGVFAAVAPAVERITGRIADGLATWSSWANSAEGKNSLAQWFEDAWKAVEKLWDLGAAALEVVGSIMGLGDDTGNDWIQGWTDALDRFAESLNTEEGRRKFQEWMEEAKTLASDLGGLVSDLGRLFSELESEGAADNLGDIMDSLGSLADGLRTISEGVTAFENFISVLETPASFDKWFDSTSIGAKIQEVEDSFNGFFARIPAFFTEMGAVISEGATGIWNAITTFVTDMGATIWEAAVTAWTGIATAVTTAFAPIVATVSETWTTIWTTVTTFTTNIWNTITTWASTVWTAIQTAWTTVLTITATVWTTIWTTITTFVSNIWNTVSGWGTNLLNTISGAWTTIVAVVTEKVEGVRAAIQSKIDAARNWLSTTWTNIQNTASTIWNAVSAAISGVVERIRSTIQSKIDAAKNAVQTAWNSVSSITSSIWNGIVGAIGGFLSGIWNTISSKVNAAKNSVQTAWNSALATTRSVWGGIVGAVSGFINTVVSTVSGLIGRAQSALSSAGSALVSAGRNLVQGLINGVRQMAGRVAEAAKGVVNGAISAAKRLLGIASPSKVFATIGEQTGEGLALGMERMRATVARTAEKMAAVAATGFDPRAMFDTGLAAGQGLAAGLASVKPSVMGALSDLTTGANVTIRPTQGDSDSRLATPGRSVVVAEGAIQVSTASAEPATVAGMVLDDLVTHVSMAG